MKYPRIEIVSDEEFPIVSKIFLDGHQLKGVRSYELKHEAGNALPILTVDLLALNLAVDSRVIMWQEAFAKQFKKIEFADGSVVDFTQCLEKENES